MAVSGPFSMKVSTSVQGRPLPPLPYGPSSNSSNSVKTARLIKIKTHTPYLSTLDFEISRSQNWLLKLIFCLFETTCVACKSSVGNRQVQKSIAGSRDFKN